MADPTKEGASGSPPEAAGEPTLEALTEQLKAELAKVPAEKLEEARGQVKEFLEGDMKWAALMSWTPEQLHEAAKEGYRQYDSGQYDKAEVIFKGLTVLDPDNFYYHQMLGACYQQQKKFPESIVEYSIAIDLKPDDITSVTNRGEVYFTLKIWDLAEHDFDEAIRLDPKEQDRWANRARMLKKKLVGIKETAGKSGAKKEKK